MPDTPPPRGMRFDATITLGHLVTAATLIASVAIGYADLAAGLRAESQHRQLLARQVETILAEKTVEQREARDVAIGLARINEQINALREELRRAIARSDRGELAPWAPAARPVP